jgi:hypothetical protein
MARGEPCRRRHCAVVILRLLGAPKSSCIDYLPIRRRATPGIGGSTTTPQCRFRYRAAPGTTQIMPGSIGRGKLRGRYGTPFAASIIARGSPLSPDRHLGTAARYHGQGERTPDPDTDDQCRLTKKTVLGGTLAPCSTSPRTGFYRDGPYEVEGDVGLSAVAWCEGASRDRFALCRCGQSKNKPLCVGSRHAAGFRG